MRKSNITKELLTCIESRINTTNTCSPIRTLNALGCSPLKYRTFGGQSQKWGRLNNSTLEAAFGSHYLLTMLTQGAIIKKILYTESTSMHTLYCDSEIYQYLERHNILNAGFWDEVNYSVIDLNITQENTDHRIYYSSCKPDAIMSEAKKASSCNMPVLFVDSDLILKSRHDAILRNPTKIHAAYGHLESIGTDCYPDFTKLHFPNNYNLPNDLDTSLPAINTCLMYFNDMELLNEWCEFFKELFIDNWIPNELNPTIISQQLLGIDQRTFAMIAARKGYWQTNKLEAFLDITWNPPFFYDNATGKRAQWHYYTLEHKPQHTDWLQHITHIWINKKNIERDIKYQNYQCCIMLEIILELMPESEKALRSFESLKPYFLLLDSHNSIEDMLMNGVVSDKLDKSL